MLDLVRQKRRFELLDKSSKKDVIKMNAFFGKYDMRPLGKRKKKYTYYDTENLDLFKSGIALFRVDDGKKHTLTMTLERLYFEDNRKLQSYRNKKNVIEIGKFDSIFKHIDFLRNSFLDMFNSSISFDADFLLKKLKQTYVIDTIAEEYRSTDGVGLKTTYSFDHDTFYNNETKVREKGDYLTVYQHSKENTDEDFLNLISKLTRYCKSITPIKESKIDIARRLTSIHAVQEKQKLISEKKKAKEAKK